MKLSSQELLSRYLKGDKNVTINQIEGKEKEERFQLALSKFSLGNSLLKSILSPIIFIGLVLVQD